MNKFKYIGNLIGCYFNQDYDVINDGEDTIEGILRFFKKSVSDNTAKNLVKDINDFISTHGNDLEEEFEKRFGFDFSPGLWETTAYEFLMMARQIMLQEEGKAEFVS